MRVAFDAVSAGGGLGAGSGGMIVYYHGALTALCERPEVEGVVALTQPWSGRTGIPQHDKLTVAVSRGLPRNRIGRVMYEQTVFPLHVARHRRDILLSACNTTPLLRRAPSVVVLHSIQTSSSPRSSHRCAAGTSA